MQNVPIPLCSGLHSKWNLRLQKVAIHIYIDINIHTYIHIYNVERY